MDRPVILGGTVMLLVILSLVYLVSKNDGFRDTIDTYESNTEKIVLNAIFLISTASMSMRHATRLSLANTMLYSCISKLVYLLYVRAGLLKVQISSSAHSSSTLHC